MPDVPKERAYAERYKNIGIIFNVLKCALIGAYVPFGRCLKLFLGALPFY